ncbi:unnamed protein product [Closterium sp. Naga37s-1]|nr:unnamed protein product [Closterium sp. Naga37s-1]
MGEPETRCVRGCCVSTTVKLNVPKAEIKTGPLIAKGPESSVYEGSYLEQPVALKKPRLSTSEDMDRFHKELKLLSSLKHPHIASLLAARAYPPDYVLIFTLYRGGNLHEALHTKQWKPSVLDILRIGYQAAQALAYVHLLGVVHRDVKPSNILIDDLGNAFLSDFGLASHSSELQKHTAANWQSSGKPTGGFHKKNMVGTLRYMAPEILAKDVHTLKSDVYSFGITLNELATGVIPYSDCTTDVQAHTVLEMDYSEQQLAAAITTFNLRPNVPGISGPVTERLRSLIGKCWHPNINLRPSMSDVAHDIESILSGSVPFPIDHTQQPGIVHNQPDPSQAFPPEEILTSKNTVLSSKVVDLAKKATAHASAISIGSFATSGAREKMEDRHFIKTFTVASSTIYMFGVFDGHRGYEAAEYCARNIPGSVMDKLSDLSPPEALIESFLATDKALELELSKQRKARPDSGKGWYPGCTACVALVIGTDMYIANAGDCRAVLKQSGEVKALSRDHVASDPEERNRAEKAGGLVQWRVNTWRVGIAGIEVTRSLGDHDMKLAVTAEPEITHHKLSEDDEFLVMASDGLWEKLSNEEVAQYVLDTVKEPSMSSKRLVTEAVDRGSQDNVTAIVAYLKNVSTVERIY